MIMGVLVFGGNLAIAAIAMECYGQPHEAVTVKPDA